MSITDELRKVAAKTECANGRCEKLYRGDLERIADRIDEEHEAQLNDAFETRNSDENLESDGWIRLPKDADGEYIHIGDEMEWCDSGDTIVVEGIGNDTIFYIEDGLAEWTAARNKRHHAPDTWERIIEDALDGYHDTDFDKLVARCKALAGDAE